MRCLSAFLCAMVASVLFVVQDTATATDTTTPAKKSAAVAKAPKKVSEAKFLTRAVVQQLLVRLEKSPAPGNLSRSTTDEESDFALGKVVFVCPVCKTSTVYKRELPPEKKKSRSKQDSWSWSPATDSRRSFLREQDEEEPAAPWSLGQLIYEDIPECRRLLKQISTLEAKLDETQFCNNCAPGVETPQLSLLIHYAGETKIRRLRGIDSDDVRLVTELLAGRTKHTARDGGESPLRDHIPRLEQLLGVSLPQSAP